MKDLIEKVFEAGTLIHIQGIPVVLAEDTKVLTIEENYQYILDLIQSPPAPPKPIQADSPLSLQTNNLSLPSV